MARYIDADKLKEKLKELRSLAYSDFDSGMLLGNEKAQAALEMMPTADVVEVKHGYWKTVTETKDNTVCGDNAKIQYKICSNCEKPMGLTGADYCGWCGAKMDVSKTETTTDGGKAE